jgi:integrase
MPPANPPRFCSKCYRAFAAFHAARLVPVHGSAILAARMLILTGSRLNEVMSLKWSYAC